MPFERRGQLKRFCSAKCRYRARDARDYSADRETELARSKDYYRRQKLAGRVKRGRWR